MVYKVFVYGTLMHEDVVRIIINRIPQKFKALLKGYHRYRLKGYVFPGILPTPYREVNGLLYTDINAEELDIFDAFEDDEYERYQFFNITRYV